MSTDMTGWCALCRAGSHNTHNAALGGICVGCACPVTAADRPSVTDNARDEEPLAWCPGCGDRIPTRVVRERGVCSECWGTRDDPWAAGRAETTTATTEDAAARLAAAEAELDRLCNGGRFIMSVPPREGYDSDLLIQAALTDLRGLLATARTRPTRDDISDAIEHSGIAIGTSDAEQAADAVMELLRDGAR